MNEVVAAKLREAREARGLSLDALGELVGQTRQTLSKYERGSLRPRPELVQRLSEELQVPLKFFLLNPEGPDLAPIFFRSLRSTLVRHRVMGQRKLAWLQRFSRLLNTALVLPEPSITDFSPPSDPRGITDDKIEQAASALRRSWGLGDGSIPDMVQLLEAKGAVIARNTLGTHTVDAFSQWSFADQRPFIILGTDKDCAVKSRFDAAHELGHLVLHKNLDKRFVTQSTTVHRLIEKQAHHFGSAFLLPRQTFASSLPRIDLDILLLAKPQWGVSVAAMIKRAVQLGMISPDRERALFAIKNQRGWAKHEPFDDTMPHEQPQLIRLSLITLARGAPDRLRNLLDRCALSDADIAEFAAMPLADIRSYRAPEKLRLEVRQGELEESM